MRSDTYHGNFTVFFFHKKKIHTDIIIKAHLNIFTGKINPKISNNSIK